jgi:hypothetical protein
MRSIRTGIESYRVDNNNYPETDAGPNAYPLGVGLFRTTTPISYLSSVPKSPFRESGPPPHGIGYPPGNPHWANLENFYLYVRAKYSPEGVMGQTDSSPIDGKDDHYNTDRIIYLGGSLATNLAVRSQGEWELKSVGPNNTDDYNVLGLAAEVYDPTNGTISEGDVIVFSDTQGFAAPK